MEHRPIHRSPIKAVRPEYHQLAVFLTVVQTGSFSGAARLLGKTQPAVSQAIVRLEEIYGGDLFERRRGALLALTPVGEAILPSARMILDTVDRQMVHAAAAAQGRAGRITLGFSSGLTAGPLRAGIVEFITVNPEVELRMVEGHPSQLYRQLVERRVDLVIAAALPDLGSKTVAREELWRERLVAAIPSRCSLSAKPTLGWPDIAALPLIVSNPDGEKLAFRLLLELSGEQRVDCTQHAASREALLQMVAMEMGIAIILESGVAPHQGVVFRFLDEEDAIVPMDALWPSADRNPVRHRLLSHIRQHRGDNWAILVGSTTEPERDHG